MKRLSRNDKLVEVALTQERSSLSALPLCLLLVCCFGCSRDLSSAAPYKSTVGSDVTLFCDMELRRPLDGKENVFKLVEPLPDGSTSTFDEHFADLAKKTSVRIDAVRAVWALNVWNVVAYGTTTIPETSKRVEWAYVWGGLTGDKGWLRLAPWENPDIVPDQRRLLEYGRVVADWWSTAPVE